MKENKLEIKDSLKDKIFQYYSSDSLKKRILLIGHTGNNTGGAEILLENMIRELLKQDVEVVVFVKNNGPIIKSYESLAPTFVVDTELKMEKYIKELFNYGFKSAILNTVISGNFLPMLKKYGFYTVHLIHELPGVIYSLNAENLARLIENYADLVVFPSNHVASNFEKIVHIKNKIILPQGLYKVYDNFNKKNSREKLAKRYGIPQDNHIILSVGRAELRKGCDLFIETYKKLKNDKFTFIWVGHIDNEMKCDGFYEISKEKNIIFTEFIFDIDDLMSFYDACDIFLLTSREDPFPSVVLEAFNAKKPVIAFENSGGFQDIVINDVTGYLVKFESINDLVSKIKFLCENDKLRDTLGENGKKIVNNYKFDVYIENLKSKCFGD